MNEKSKDAQPGEPQSKQVFDVFDRASSHKPNQAAPYFVGDGIVVRIGWVDSDDDTNLTVELRDEKLGKAVSLTVGPETSRYTRQTAPSFSLSETLLDREKRRQIRETLRREPFSIPTASLAPVAQAVGSHDPHTEPEPPESERMHESSLAVAPIPTTDIASIRELIDTFSRPLD